MSTTDALPFCATIDRAADDDLPYFFGVNHYVAVRYPEEPPNRLARLDALMTS